MKIINLFLLLFLLYIIISEEVYESPCERFHNPTKAEDCYGRSCEFIEEVCCYLESKVNDTEANELITKYECVDFIQSDYDVPDQKQIAIERIKNGTYWFPIYNNTYDQIISLKCESSFIFSKIFSFLLFLIL